MNDINGDGSVDACDIDQFLGLVFPYVLIVADEMKPEERESLKQDGLDAEEGVKDAERERKREERDLTAKERLNLAALEIRDNYHEQDSKWFKLKLLMIVVVLAAVSALKCIGIDIWPGVN